MLPRVKKTKLKRNIRYEPMQLRLVEKPVFSYAENRTHTHS